MSKSKSKSKQHSDWKSLVNWREHDEPTLTLKGLVWAPRLRAEPDPIPDPAATDPAPPTDPAPTPPTPADHAEDEEIKNPQGLLSALNKYKAFGSVKDIEKMQGELARFNAIMQSIQSQGISSIGEIPSALQKMRDEETKRQEAEAEVAKRIEAEIAAFKTEAMQKVAEAEKKASDADTDRIDTLRKVAVQKYYDVNCKPEFVEEFDRWYPNVIGFIEFEERSDKVKQILNPDGSQLIVEGPDKKAKAAGMVDLFNAMVEGKYGSLNAAPLKPVSAAQGGTAINPVAAAGANGSLRLPKNFNVGTATPEELKAIRAKKYTLGN